MEDVFKKSDEIILDFLSPQVKAYLQSLDEEEQQSDKMYLRYPALFSAAFAGIKPSQIALLNTAGFLYYKAILLLDNITDNPETQEAFASDFMLISKLQEESVKRLSRLFDLPSLFWQLWEKRQQEYFSAIALEKQIGNEITFAKYKKLADLKSAMGKVAIDSLYMLSEKKDKEKYEDLLQSHYHFSVGLQLIDDIQDMDEDYRNGQFNWAFYATTTRLKAEEYEVQKMSLADIKKLSYIKGIASEIRQKAIIHFKKSKQIALKYGVSGWINLIDEKIKVVSITDDQTQGYMEILKEKIRIQNDTNKIPIEIPAINIKDKCIKNGINYLLKQWQNGYKDLKHLMYLSKYDEFSESRVHIGDVFQRAMVANVLLDIQEKFSIDLNEIVNQEVNYLLNNKLETKTGGWNYYPTCPEISPDADDLGEIMRVFIRSNKAALIEKDCKKLIEILINDRTHKDGGIETWIIPQKGQTKQEQRQMYFNTTKWGCGPDNEVMANFLFGLYFHNFDKFCTFTKKGCQYLARQQDEQGFWESRWYLGPFYGTYTCLRLFKAMNVENEAIKRAKTFILQSQNKDGGWGFSEQSDSLSTALALLCLEDKNRKSAKAGLAYLHKTQNNDGSWAAVPFIRPRSNESYKSIALTTALVLKALVKAPSIPRRGKKNKKSILERDRGV